MKIFNSSNPVAVALTLCSFVIMLGTFLVLDGSSEKFFTISELDKKERSWKITEPKNYDYKFEQGCMWVDKTMVKVRNRTMVEFKFESSMTYLFKVAREAVLSAHNYEIKFHPLGFPSSITVDWDKSIIDDECFIIISNFEVLVANEL